MVIDNLPMAHPALPRQPAVNFDLSWYYLAMEADGLSTATLDAYRCAMRCLIRFVGDKPLTTLDTNDLRAWAVWLRRSHLKANTQARYWRDVRKLYRWCQQEGLIRENPTDRIRGPKTEQVAIKPFQPHHVSALLRLCPPNRWWGARDAAIVTMFLTTGIRVSELVALKDVDLNLDTRSMYVRGKGDQGSSAKERVAYLTPKTLSALLRWFQQRQRILSVAPELNGYVWLSYTVSKRHWHAMTVNGVKQMIYDLGKRAGIKDRRVSPHTFRHTFGCQMAVAGMSLPKLQYLMGHDSMQATLRYIRYAAEVAARQEQADIDPFQSWAI